MLSEAPSFSLPIRQKPKPNPNILEILPAEVRIKIYECIFDDLIEELSDNLFGVFYLYDSLYDYTGSHHQSHVGKSGLSLPLFTCKQMHDEAFKVLCEKAEFVVNLMGDDDEEDKERVDVRLPPDTQILRYASHLKVNVEPEFDKTIDRFVARIERFLSMINDGTSLRSLTIRIESGKLASPESMEKILEALTKLRKTRKNFQVCLGDVPEELLSAERFGELLTTLKATSNGRRQPALEPNHYEYEDDEDDDED
ncbi:hypothetical protein F5Y18DRAFT_379841 [Xylariaceae sp. FL1019]|nr:hypothetical protein F5Y18DRAFT_379841 [Xylariaceae sp. FL1019]